MFSFYHLQVRKYIRTYAKPGLPMVDICKAVENTVGKLILENGLHVGIAFPTGCSLNWYKQSESYLFAIIILKNIC